MTSVHGENDLAICHPTCLIAILTAAVLANNISRTYKFKHETTVADLNQFTARKCTYLLIILMDDAVILMCIWQLVWSNSKYKPLQLSIRQ